MTNKKNNNKKNSKKNRFPFVSVCTPTFNRRPFISYLIKCFENQTYPKNRMEWIIIDDGTDKIEDLVKDIPQIKYFKYDKKMTLGEKRNLMHKKTCGEIIVYMDDDDYYPPTRVSHAVHMLKTHPSALCSGCSMLNIYFKHINKIVQFGPYGEKHATAASFAFRRKLLEENKYEDTAALAEEKAFLKNYTVPFVQLDSEQTILVFSHEHNTFDKKKLLENPFPEYVRETDKTVDSFIKDPEILDFYVNKLDAILKDYEPGRPTMKPDVLIQLVEIEEKRRKHAEELTKQFQNDNGRYIIKTNNNGEQEKLNLDQIFTLLQEQQQHISNLTEQLKGKNTNEKCIILKNEDGSQEQLTLEKVVIIIKQLNNNILNLKEELNIKNSIIKELSIKLEENEKYIEKSKIPNNYKNCIEEENIKLKITENTIS